MVKDSNGAWSQEWLWWQRPAANYWSALWIHMNIIFRTSLIWVKCASCM
jgi:hypothetical protein